MWIGALWSLIHIFCQRAYCLKPQDNGPATVLGIDFGSQYIKTSFIHPSQNDPLQILVDEMSQRTTFNAVSFREDLYSFGVQAVSDSFLYPENVFMMVYSHLLGRLFDDPMVQVFQGLFPNKIRPDPARGTVEILLDSRANKYVAPEYLVAMIFNRIKQQAERVSGRSVHGAVITIPAYFSQFQRQSILDAAEIAQLPVFALMTDASAAAAYYGTNLVLESTPKGYHVFVDSGATGTTAVLAEIDPAWKDEKTGLTRKSIEIKAVSSDPTLGGSEIDVRLAYKLAEEFSQKSPGKSIKKGSGWNRLLNAVHNTKKDVITGQVKRNIEIENIDGHATFSGSISLEDIEKAAVDLLPRFQRVIEAVLAQAEVPLVNIGSVFLVGGNLRVPSIKAHLEHVFGLEQISYSLNGDEAIAKGAAFYAAQFFKGFHVVKFRFRDAYLPGVIIQYSQDQESQLKTLQVYPPGASYDSHKAVSFRNINSAKVFVQNFNPGLNLYNLDISGFEEALKSLEPQKILSAKIKFYLDIDLNGLVLISPPIAAVDAEQIVAPAANSTAEPAVQAVKQEIPLTHKIISARTPFNKESVQMYQRMIAAYMELLERRRKESQARNSVDSMMYGLGSLLNDGDFTEWFQQHELAALSKSVKTIMELRETKQASSLEECNKWVEDMKSKTKPADDRKMIVEQSEKAVSSSERLVQDIGRFLERQLELPSDKRPQTDEEMSKLEAGSNGLRRHIESVLKEMGSTPKNQDLKVDLKELGSKDIGLRMEYKMLELKKMPEPRREEMPAADGAKEDRDIGENGKQQEQNIEENPKEEATIKGSDDAAEKTEL